ncbi:unnamed protein product, partial [Coccothraustes coccothraustes]
GEFWGVLWIWRGLGVLLVPPRTLPAPRSPLRPSRTCPEPGGSRRRRGRGRRFRLASDRLGSARRAAIGWEPAQAAEEGECEGRAAEEGECEGRAAEEGECEGRAAEEGDWWHAALSLGAWAPDSMYRAWDPCGREREGKLRRRSPLSAPARQERPQRRRRRRKANHAHALEQRAGHSCERRRSGKSFSARRAAIGWEPAQAAEAGECEGRAAEEGECEGRAAEEGECEGRAAEEGECEGRAAEEGECE